MASLSYLQPYLDEIHEKAVEWNVRSPLIDALQDQLIGRPFELCKRTQCLCIMSPVSSSSYSRLPSDPPQRLTNKSHSAEHHFKSEEGPASRTDNSGPLKVRPQARESLRIPRTSRRSRALPTHLRSPERGNSCSGQGSQPRSGFRSDHATSGAPLKFAADKIA